MKMSYRSVVVKIYTREKFRVQTEVNAMIDVVKKNVQCSVNQANQSKN